VISRRAAERAGHPDQLPVYATIMEAVPEANRAAPSDVNQADNGAIIYSELQTATSTT